MADVWSDIASEFLHLYPRGRRVLAVAGADAERSRRSADELAQALSATGLPVERVHTADGDEQALRSETIAPFRASSASDGVLLVSGPSTLLSETARGMWHYVVWQLADDEAPHTVAAAIVDVTDPANPTRRFADYCALPASYGG